MSQCILNIDGRTVFIAAILCLDLGNYCVEGSQVLVSLSFLDLGSSDNVDVLSVLDSLLDHFTFYIIGNICIQSLDKYKLDFIY